jgi:hypothetical protein
MNQTRPALRFTLAAACALASAIAVAGRPLAVDDANVNEAGHGQLEAWTARGAGSAAYNLAPAYAPIDGLELGALLTRDTRAATTLGALQAKWLVTPAKENGCNNGVVLGWSHTSGEPHTAYLNGLLSCNRAERGSTHVNLGVSKAEGASRIVSWGIAHERQWGGVTPNIEWFGGQGSKPAIQVGARGNIAGNLQLDGSVGRRGGAMLYTLGTKLQF